MTVECSDFLTTTVKEKTDSNRTGTNLRPSAKQRSLLRERKCNVQNGKVSANLGLLWWLRGESPPAMQETRLDPWVGKTPLRRVSFLENPMTEEPEALQSVGSQRVGHD